MIKANGSINSQISDAYMGKFAGKTLKQGSFNQSKYMTSMNQS